MRQEFGILLLLAVLTTAAQATNLSDVILNGMSSSNASKATASKPHGIKDSFYGGKDFAGILIARR